MIKKNNIVKSGISIFLILAIFSFKILDLHKYSHDKHSEKGNHCELCLLVSKQKHASDFDIPVAFDFKVFEPVATRTVAIFYTEFKKVVRFPFGKSLNKPPPVLSV